jgi:hypothetical protein
LRPIIDAPTLIGDTSTTEVSPVRSRQNNAPAILPAMVIPPIESPYAPVGWLMTRGLSDGVADHALAVRHQKVEPSYPPFPASGPFGP